ncbi:hypothetical protein GCM10025861_23420 [Methanobacterium petrolearium]|nr:hypothetical protein GCM10025861_23420 [Methanobacterium petrolearium]
MCISYKKEVVDKIGLFDKRFFLYFEEIDLALKASKIGYKSFFVPGGKFGIKYLDLGVG